MVSDAVKSAAAAAFSSNWWFVARCPQTAAIHWNKSSSTGCLGYFYLQSAWHFRDAAAQHWKGSWAGVCTNTPHKTHTQTHWACAKFHRAVKAIRDRWERRVSGGEPHAGGLEAITRCHNNTLRNLCALFLFAVLLPKFRWKECLPLVPLT